MAKVLEIVLPALVAAFGMAIGWYIKNKQVLRLKIAAEIAIAVFETVEANYKEWGITGADKMIEYTRMFFDRYQAATGEKPNGDLIDHAQELAEIGVKAQNEKK